MNVKCKSFPLLATLILVLSTSFSYGQKISNDSTSVDISKQNAIALYTKSIRDQSLLFNGIEYKAIPEPYNGFPYFGTEYIEEGSIYYDGELYSNISIQYDLVHDLLIMEHYDQKGYVSMIEPHQEKVSYFQLLNHTFIRISGDSSSEMRTGFYDLLYDGKVKVLARRKKNISQIASGGQLDVRFNERNVYYLMKDGKYHSIKNKGSVMKVLNDKRKSLNQYVSKNKSKVDFSMDREGAMVALATQYDQIQEGER
jgi:hypothetical protein